MNTSITKPTLAGDANPDARPVKDVIEPAKAVLGKVSVSVQTALDEMQAQGIDSALVTNQRGELLGTVSSNEMNRKVGGLGHDPKTEPVEAQVEKKNVYCFEDQTVAEAEQIMCDAKVAEVPVVTREKLLLGTTNLEAIAQDNDGEDPRTSGKRLYSKKTFFAVFIVSGGLLLACTLLLRRYSILRLYELKADKIKRKS
jgi:CBS domain-containing protein